MKKESIRHRAEKWGADAVGFASIDNYHSKRSPDPAAILPCVRSMVVLGYRENHGAVESPNARIAMGSRMGAMELAAKNNYQLARYLETTFGCKAAPIPFSYPLDMGPEGNGLIGDVSLRHAAVAAGLGVFGRHNLVIHPRFGSRITFTAILTDLPLSSDPPVNEDLCSRCGLCVEECPGEALNEEGKTNVFHCLKSSQPYGIGGAVRFLKKWGSANREERPDLLKHSDLLHLYQAQFIGFQYVCFRCMTVCPACS